jgi:hypothetical protein
VYSLVGLVVNIESTAPQKPHLVGMINGEWGLLLVAGSSLLSQPLFETPEPLRLPHDSTPPRNATLNPESLAPLFFALCCPD